LPTAVLAAAAFADVMPPAMYCAIAWAIDVRGVTLMPVVVEPAVTEGTQLVITSPDCMVIGFPVPGSMKVPPVIRNITVPAYAPSGMLKLPVASTLLMPICGPIVPSLIEYAIIVPEDVLGEGVAAQAPIQGSDAEAGPLVVGGVEPEHPLEGGAGFGAPAERPQGAEAGDATREKGG